MSFHFSSVYYNVHIVNDLKFNIHVKSLTSILDTEWMPETIDGERCYSYYMFSYVTLAYN